MAVSLSWTIETSPNLTIYTNLTSRTAGFDINEQVNLNTMASFTATVTLNNFDGALTPGGGGTYSSYDWFARDIKFTATATDGASSSSVTTFQGLITGFNLYDDGETSTVTLTCVDMWTVAGRTKQGTITAIGLQSPIVYLSAAATSGQFSTAFPLFNASSADVLLVDLGDQLNRQVLSTVAVDNVSFADLINQVVAPSQNGFMWPGTMTQPFATTFVDGYWIGGGMTRDVAKRKGWTFDPPASMAGTDLPFTNLEQGWNIDDTINTATFTSIDQPFGPIPQTATDTTAANKYGSRAVQFGQVASPATLTLDLATELENRFATPTFAPATITTTASAIKAYCANAAYTAVADLLNLEHGFIDKATITWTGAGAASQTATCVILGKRIKATPSDTTITLSLGKWTDFHSFILNTDKLNTDRLG